MRNTRKDVTTFGTDVIKKTERINKVSFRICKKPKPRKKKWYDNIRNYFNRWFSLANR